MRTDTRRFRLSISLIALAVLVIPLWAGQGHYDPTRKPRADISAALTKARSDKKLVLLDFGADWCLDCVVLSALFRDKTVAPYLNQHFHVVQIDIGEWNRNLDVSREYGDPIKKGVPAVVVLSPLGSTVASTGNGALSTARNAKASDILKLLQSWVAKAR
jgi:thiol:disulfide interchange protein